MHEGGPGVFLQGLAVHGRGGAALSDAALPADVVAQAFRWAGGQAGQRCLVMVQVLLARAPCSCWHPLPSNHHLDPHSNQCMIS